MKMYYSLLCVLLLNVSIYAQAPQGFSYQAIIKGVNNILVVNKPVGMKISLLQGSEKGSAVYVETHKPISNENGLVSIAIGEGTKDPSSETFANIDWSKGPYFIKTETDPSGETNYALSSISQLLSVPYALYAANSQPGPKGEKGDQGSQGSIGLTGPVGPQGADGKTVLSGIEVPSSDQGSNGDFYINTSNNTIYGPKVNGVWPSGISLVGSTGPQGPAAFSHYIGEEFGGGVIFHLWKDKTGLEHGLILNLKHNSPHVWSNLSNSLIGESAKSSWDGVSNCNAIINQQGHTASAAKICMDIIDGGQSDWYLPSMDELNLLWLNRFDVNKSLLSISGASPLASNSSFWSSAEYNASNAYYYSFSSGGLNGSSSKNSTTMGFRAIRAF